MMKLDFIAAVAERTIKRLWLFAIGLILASCVTNAAWIVHWLGR